MKRFRQAFLLSRTGSVELLSEIDATRVVRMLFEMQEMKKMKNCRSKCKGPRRHSYSQVLKM